MKLMLGIVDVPYSDSKDAQTTGDVATILEEKYHIMQIFFDLHEKQIAGNIEDSIAGAIENVIAGRGANQDLFAGAMGKTEKAFKRYLDDEEMAGVANGVPTQAALDGKSSRRKKKREIRGTKKTMLGMRRPSFIDSGTYRKMFKSWIEE